MGSGKLFNKDFILVVIGQIISLFGNGVLRFALPLYLLNQTKSPALFGIVSACSFIPMIILTPVGGIIADRVNKRNVMVILDFSTAFLVTILTLLLGKVDLVLLLLIALVLLYGIQGAYQPAVQASIPALIRTEDLMPANAIINLVNSLANLIGPVIGGAIFGFWGLRPILIISIICFFISAVMEIFIHIPFERKKVEQKIIQIVSGDIKESISFIRYQQPIIGKVTLIITGINLFLSALVIISIPVIVIQRLGFDEGTANQLYGYAEGVFAAGGILGGILAGTLSKKLKVQNAYRLLVAAGITLVPIGLILIMKIPAMASYTIILISCFIMMLSCSLCSIQLMAYLQMITPQHLVGKIMSLVMGICMCAQPLGQTLYGTLLQAVPNQMHIIFIVAAAITCTIGILSKVAFNNIQPQQLISKES